tara:strand:+ start:71 stop:361 length:291 start_codon:yes stop_codon:yes gene_type:complete
MIKKNFNRKNLVKKIHQNIGFSKNFSSKIVDSFFESLVSTLEATNKIKISTFGTFKVINTKERIGRNPKTKVEAKILSRKVVKFKASPYVKKEINK